MTTYKTPGVYIEEISVFPPSVAAVETAIPVFLGYTQKAVDSDGSDLTGVPKRITSLLEYERFFGTETPATYQIQLASGVADTSTSFTSSDLVFTTAPSALPETLLYHSMRMFFSNGGGPCYIVSLGAEGATPAATDFTDAITALEAYDEPTLLVFPDATIDATVHAAVVDAALLHCSKMQDRFTIIDVPGADATVADPGALIASFRDDVPVDLALTKYGAAYYPYLATSLAPTIDEAKVEVKGGPFSVADPTPLNDPTIKDAHSAFYNAAKAFLSERLFVTLPPSGAVAGVYARVDESRGVWHAPANASLLNVIAPVLDITNDLNDSLNVDPTAGKSINAIRAFTGKGTLVWGARTLAGNDNENRYISVRRFLNFAEESIKKATGAFVFESNDANTWVKVKSMIDNFLTIQWRAGALAGAKPENAFYVAVGLNKTMTAQDILDGYMIVEIGLAIVRPAEFIVLRFMQKMQES